MNSLYKRTLTNRCLKQLYKYDLCTSTSLNIANDTTNVISVQTFKKQFNLNDAIFFHINNPHMSIEKQRFIKQIQEYSKHCYFISDSLLSEVCFI